MVYPLTSCFSPQQSGIEPPTIRNATKGELSLGFLPQLKYCFELVLLFPYKGPPGKSLDSATHAIFIWPYEINAGSASVFVFAY
jgi:hypothetical protein